MFTLYRNNKIILNATSWETLYNIVEILKKYNKKFVNRKEFTIKKNESLVYSWKRK